MQPSVISRAVAASARAAAASGSWTPAEGAFLHALELYALAPAAAAVAPHAARFSWPLEAAAAAEVGSPGDAAQFLVRVPCQVFLNKLHHSFVRSLIDQLSQCATRVFSDSARDGQWQFETNGMSIGLDDAKVINRRA